MKKKLNSFLLVMILVVTCVCIRPLTAIAATSSSVTSRSAMSLALEPGRTGTSNTISFKFNGLPDNAMVDSIKIDCTDAKKIGNGMGAIAPMSMTITNPSGFVQNVPWGSGNITNTSVFNDLSAKGTWQISMTGRNVAPITAGSRFVAGVKYSNVKMTITYYIEN
ncbi:hypothetical protein SAMN04487831_106168 [Pseudobutyrivibrio sp. UC1225]|uniref:hypothetical protein n=1 Tax=Pseudobutyrivibrio sp. UC1225 TaxID=1798185 RepID=UPI0008E6C07A|nr:hypothetical protein [Pseudobutyrivibrio sp. UC1225]SFO04384.1 hypothetical protein SAMN04487831_106168 [Pseudobutyrivibrio sp. UC1225]